MLFTFLEVGVKGRLESVHMNLLVIVTQIYPGRLSLILLRGEGAIHVLDSRTQLGAEIGKYPDKLRILNAGVAVKKTVQLLAMPMQIQNESDLSLLAEFLDEAFNASYFRHIKLFLSGIPLPIQVSPAQVGPVVPEDHPIWIHHRDHIDDVVFPQVLSLLRALLQQPVNHPIAHKRTLSLSWMLPRHHNQSLSVIFLLTCLLGDHQRLDILLGDGLADGDPAHDVRVFAGNGLQSVEQFLVGIGVGVREVELVVGELVGDLEGEFIVVPSGVLSGETAFFVGDILASPVPLSAVLALLHRGEDGGPHTVVEERVVFCEIDDIEGVLGAGHHALH